MLESGNNESVTVRCSGCGAKIMVTVYARIDPSSVVSVENPEDIKYKFKLEIRCLRCQ